MGLLTWDGSLAGMSKATISLWFRIPTEAFNAAATPGAFWGFEVFNGVIPVLVLGTQKTGPTASAETVVIGEFMDPDTHEMQNVFGSINRVRDAPMSPTVIGIKKSTETATPSLFVHLQTQDMSAHANSNQDTTGWIPTRNDLGEITGVYQYTGVDASHADDELEFFENWTVDVSLDRWHHLLISWELGGRNASH